MKRYYAVTSVHQSSKVFEDKHEAEDYADLKDGDKITTAYSIGELKKTFADEVEKAIKTYEELFGIEAALRLFQD